MGLTIEQDCPQCGAPVDIDETDHLFDCPFCDVKSFIYTPDYSRFILPHNAPNKEIIYAPYLRFSGPVFYCRDKRVGGKMWDITDLAIKSEILPPSLGVRLQSIKPRYIVPDTQGTFLKCQTEEDKLLSKTLEIVASGFNERWKEVEEYCSQKLNEIEEKQFRNLEYGANPLNRTQLELEVIREKERISNSSQGPVLCHAFLSDCCSIMYLPLYKENGIVFDAITNESYGGYIVSESSFNNIESDPKWKLDFLPTLCPKCGWDLEGIKNSVVLTCSNCNTAWQATENGFSPVHPFTVRNELEQACHVPFWKITARTNGDLEIGSYEDFLRLTGLRKYGKRELQKDKMDFWIPAFKTQPEILLDMAQQVTFSQCDFQMERKVPQQNVQPVTIAYGEAYQMLKMVIANSTTSGQKRRERLFPLLTNTDSIVGESCLVYLPFSYDGYDLYQKETNVHLYKGALGISPVKTKVKKAECPLCGKEIKASSTRCTYCGISL